MTFGPRLRFHSTRKPRGSQSRFSCLQVLGHWDAGQPRSKRLGIMPNLFDKRRKSRSSQGRQWKTKKQCTKKASMPILQEKKMNCQQQNSTSSMFKIEIRFLYAGNVCARCYWCNTVCSRQTLYVPVCERQHL